MSVLRIERRDRVAILTFDDPDRRNVVSDEMNEELLAAFDDLESDDGIGAVVLTGAGRAFCAGAVLDDLLEAGEGDSEGSLPDIYRGFLRVAHTTLPTVAAVNGAAVGAGMNMVLACDLVVADETVKVAVSEARIGINAVDIPLKLARKLGYAKAFALLAPGDAKDAAWCQAAGLVEIVTPAGQAQSRAFELATDIAQSCAPLAVQAQKETLWRAVFEDEAAGRRAGMNWRELTRSSRDYAEGQTAFIERRKPIFTGK